MENVDQETGQGAVAPMSLMASGFKDAWDSAIQLSRSSLIPEHFRGRPENVLLAMEIAQNMDIPFLTICRNLYEIKGRPAWNTSFLIATLNRSKKFGIVKYNMVGQDSKMIDDLGCRAYATSLLEQEVVYGPLVTVKMAKDEGWYGRKGSKWPNMPELMLMYRAAGFFVRLFAPEVSHGFYSVDEAMDIPAASMVPFAASNSKIETFTSLRNATPVEVVEETTEVDEQKASGWDQPTPEDPTAGIPINLMEQAAMELRINLANMTHDEAVQCSKRANEIAGRPGPGPGMV